MPPDFPSFHDAHGERVSFVEILRSMFAEGRPDPEAMLDEADRYFCLIGSPEADRMSAGLRDQVRELRSGRYAESSLREDLGGLWEADQERLEGKLRGDGRLSGQSVPFRNFLDRIAYLGNEVVHKGAVAGREDARRPSAQAERFTSEIPARVFGFSIS